MLYKNKKWLFELVHLLKIAENYLWRSWSIMKLKDANLQVNKKQTLSHILLYVFAFIFLQYITVTSSERLWKGASAISFRKYERKVELLVIDLFR